MFEILELDGAPEASRTDDGRRGPHADRIFWTVTVAFALETIIFTLVVPALPVFSQQYGLSDSAASIIFGTFPVAQLLTCLVIARRADTLGRRRTLLTGFSLLVLSTFGFSLVSDPALLMLARALQGVGAGLTWVAGVAAIADSFPESELGYRIGLAELAGGGVGLLGPLVGGPLISLIGIKSTFRLTALFAAIVLIPLRSTPETRRIEAKRLPLMRTLRTLFRRPEARLGGSALALGGLVLAFVEPLMPLDLERRLGISPTGTGLVLGAGLIAYLMATPIAGRWSDRNGRRTPILVGASVVAAALPFCAVGSVYTVALAFAFLGLGVSVMLAAAGPLLVVAVDRAGLRGRYGFSAAVLTGIFATGYTLGPLIAAIARTVIPFTTVAILVSAATVIIAIAMSRLQDPPSPEESSV